MTISLEQVPANMQTPGQFLEIDASRAIGGITVDSHRILVVGQRLSTGTVAAGVATRITNSAEAEVFFGRGSMLSSMILALAEVTTYQQVWAIALDDDPAGQAASGNLLVGGAVSGAGTINLYVAGKRIRVGVKTTDSLENIATNIVDAINDDTTLSVTAAVDGTEAKQVNLTARHKGLVGNDIDIRFNYNAGESLPNGLTVTITGMSGGTANPDVATAIAALGDTRYHHIVCPYTDSANLSAWNTELEKRFGPVDTKQSALYTAIKGSLNSNITDGEALNSPHITAISMPSVPEGPEVWAAKYAGVIAFSAEIDPARPFQTLKLHVMAPAAGDEYTREEQEQLLTAGLSTFTVDNGGNVRIQRAVTTYKTNAQGVPDKAFKDLNSMHTLGFLRESVTSHIARVYPRHKLADNGTRFAAGQAVATPDLVRAEIISIAVKLERMGIVEDLPRFKKELVVIRDSEDVNGMLASIPFNLVNQFRKLAGKIEFRL